MTRPFRSGDAVAIGFDGRTVEGSVMLASSNGLSLMLQFEAVLGGFLGEMPVMGDGSGGYRDLVSGRPVTIKAINDEGMP